MRELASVASESTLVDLVAQREPFVLRNYLSTSPAFASWLSAGGSERLATCLEAKGPLPLCEVVLAVAWKRNKLIFPTKAIRRAYVQKSRRLRKFWHLRSAICGPRSSWLPVEILAISLTIAQAILSVLDFLRKLSYGFVAHEIYVCVIFVIYRCIGSFLSLTHLVLTCEHPRTQMYFAANAPSALELALCRPAALPAVPGWTYREAKMWIASPVARSTPFHFDHFANLLVQVAGTKRVTFVPPHETGKLRPMPGDHHFKVPYMSDTSGAYASATDVELAPGDVLYVPPHWPHCTANVSGLNMGFNVFYNSELTSVVGSKAFCGASSRLFSRLLVESIEAKHVILSRFGSSLGFPMDKVDEVEGGESEPLHTTEEELITMLAHEDSDSKAYGFLLLCETNGCRYNGHGVTKSTHAGTLGDVPVGSLFFKV